MRAKTLATPGHKGLLFSKLFFEQYHFPCLLLPFEKPVFWIIL